MTKRQANFLLTAAIVAFAAALAFFLQHRYFDGPDTDGARAEVQRYYGAHDPAVAVEVRSCSFVEDPAGVDHARFSCTIATGGRTCVQPRLFDVPREDTLTPQNFDAQPLLAEGPPRC
jgi:hypothetical protein